MASQPRRGGRSAASSSAAAAAVVPMAAVEGLDQLVMKILEHLPPEIGELFYQRFSELIEMLYNILFPELTRNEATKRAYFKTAFMSLLLAFYRINIDDPNEVTEFINRYASSTIDTDDETMITGKATTVVTDLGITPEDLNKLRVLLTLVGKVLIGKIQIGSKTIHSTEPLEIDETEIEDFERRVGAPSSAMTLKELLDSARGRPKAKELLENASLVLVSSNGPIKDILLVRILKYRDLAKAVLMLLLVEFLGPVLGVTSLLGSAAPLLSGSFPIISSSTISLATALGPLTEIILRRVLPGETEPGIKQIIADSLSSCPREVGEIARIYLDRIDDIWGDFTGRVGEIRIELGRHVVVFATEKLPGAISSVASSSLGAISSVARRSAEASFGALSYFSTLIGTAGAAITIGSTGAPLPTSPTALEMRDEPLELEDGSSSLEDVLPASLEAVSDEYEGDVSRKPETQFEEEFVKADELLHKLEESASAEEEEPAAAELPVAAEEEEPVAAEEEKPVAAEVPVAAEDPSEVAPMTNKEQGLHLKTYGPESSIRAVRAARARRKGKGGKGGKGRNSLTKKRHSKRHRKTKKVHRSRKHHTKRNKKHAKRNTKRQRRH